MTVGYIFANNEIPWIKYIYIYWLFRIRRLRNYFGKYDVMFRLSVFLFENTTNNLKILFLLVLFTFGPVFIRISSFEIQTGTQVTIQYKYIAYSFKMHFDGRKIIFYSIFLNQELFNVFKMCCIYYIHKT